MKKAVRKHRGDVIPEPGDVIPKAAKPVIPLQGMEPHLARSWRTLPQRINPHTGNPYGPLMASYDPETLTEYERKWGQYTPCYQEHARRVVRGVLVIAELDRATIRRLQSLGPVAW